jgi:hypothetical protein
MSKHHTRLLRLLISSKIGASSSYPRYLGRHTERLVNNMDQWMRITGCWFPPFPNSSCKCIFLSLYSVNLLFRYNRGRISEEFEILCQRLQERYVGSETTSSCNIWFNHDISNKVHNVNSRRRSTGHSPGSRLSHLARRRQTFSSANLLNSNVAGQLPGNHHPAALERRLIMVDPK